MNSKFRYLICFVALVTYTFFVYRNHFDNSFQFDDFHTIVNNPAITTLRNIPRFFTNPLLFSVAPENQTYRPITSISLAIDYALADGLNPFWFHFSTFFWFIVTLGAIWILYFRLFLFAEFNVTKTFWLSFFATSCFALHPVCAETINYVIQRADLYATLACVVSLITFDTPPFRKKNFYLIPFILGCFAKQSTLILPLLLFWWCLLKEQRWSLRATLSETKTSLIISLKRILFPTFIALALFIIQQSMMGPLSSTGGSSRWLYLLTQIWVIPTYIFSLIFPIFLSADTDETLITSITDARLITGMTICIGIFILLIWTLQCNKRFPLSFGILWFITALIPTSSLIPLAEVANDHRMFFPFVGGVIACAFILSKGYDNILQSISSDSKKRLFKTPLAVIGCAYILIPFSFGTYLRTEVWDSHRTLWTDTVHKSPLNGRAMMNLGLSYMTDGDFENADKWFSKAAQLIPNYSHLQVNIGILASATGDLNRAIPHFEKAININPYQPSGYTFYAHWLTKAGNTTEAEAILQRGLKEIPFDIEIRQLLIQKFVERNQMEQAKKFALEGLEIYPHDAFFLKHSN